MRGGQTPSRFKPSLSGGWGQWQVCRGHKIIRQFRASVVKEEASEAAEGRPITPITDVPEGRNFCAMGRCC